MNENSKQVIDKALELRRQYMREYRRKNAEKVREWNANYWKRKAEKATAREKV